MRPNVVPSVLIVPASLHSLCVRTGDIYDGSQMLVTLRLHHQAPVQRKRVVLGERIDLQPATLPLGSFKLGLMLLFLFSYEDIFLISPLYFNFSFWHLVLFCFALSVPGTKANKIIFTFYILPLLDLTHLFPFPHF